MSQTGMYAWCVVLFFAVAVGVVAGLEPRRHRAIVVGRSNVAARVGWVYFLSSVGGAEEDPPAPIKVGFTHRDPRAARLPEIETMSPKPLEVLDVIRTEAPELLEQTIHAELSFARHHGEWFDRDAVLAWLDNYKEKS